MGRLGFGDGKESELSSLETSGSFSRLGWEGGYEQEVGRTGKGTNKS